MFIVINKNYKWYVDDNVYINFNNNSKMFYIIFKNNIV